MARCIDTAGWGAKVSKPLLWSRIIGYGTVPGTRRKGLDIDLGESPIGWRDYDTATGALRSWGLTSRTADTAEGDARSMFLAATHELPSLLVAWRHYEEAIASLGVFDFSGILEGTTASFALASIRPPTSGFLWTRPRTTAGCSWRSLVAWAGISFCLVTAASRSTAGAARASIFAGFEGTRLDLPTNYRSEARDRPGRQCDLQRGALARWRRASAPDGPWWRRGARSGV